MSACGRQGGDRVNVIPTGGLLGARVEGLDLSQRLPEATIDALMQALAVHGVLRFPGQSLNARAQADFSARFGELEVNVAGAFQDPEIPAVMTLSNIVRDGRPIGLGDAGQDWHTDMSYSRMIAYANVLHGVEIPQRDGQPLGATVFRDMRAAWDALPAALSARLEGLTVTHDFEKFWEKMRREPGSRRQPLTAAQRAAKPPVSHPLCLVHPLSGRKALYANPGYAVRINELPPDESDATLAYLFEHQLQERFGYVFRWTRGDVLMWDNLATIHMAVADYRPDEPRLIRRCQVMATRFYGAA
jgi:taurine dioxygenase